MPLVQIDVQPLNDDQRAELRRRAVKAISDAIGTPGAYVNIIIRESEPSHLVEAGASGPYDHREAIGLRGGAQGNVRG